MSGTGVGPGTYGPGNYKLKSSGNYVLKDTTNSSMTASLNAGVTADILLSETASQSNAAFALNILQPGASAVLNINVPGSMNLVATVGVGDKLTLGTLSYAPFQLTAQYNINGGTFEFVGSDLDTFATEINLGGNAQVGNNTIIIDGAATDLSAVRLTGFDATDKVEIAGATAVTGETQFYYLGYDPETTVTFDNGAQVTLEGTYDLSQLHLSENSSGYGVLSVCFLRGTMISTAFGEVPVETLSESDRVITMTRGHPSLQKVRWLGASFRRVNDGDGDEAYPVRIRADAFAAGKPSRDLLVTPEHCILVDGVLIPARMLVNGGSIISDRSIRAYEYFHVELDRHEILLSNGLTTESYLDTGNRSVFASAREVEPVRAITPAAPIVTDRDVVEPIWHLLVARSASMGYSHVSDRHSHLIDDPGLYLELSDGSELRPNGVAVDGVYSFSVNPGQHPARLCSRAAVPSDVVGPFVDDRRKLGVCVSAITVSSYDGEMVQLASAFEGSGWHNLEASARWTDGRAEITLPAMLDQDSRISVHVVSKMCYRQHAQLEAFAA